MCCILPRCTVHRQDTVGHVAALLLHACQALCQAGSTSWLPISTLHAMQPNRMQATAAHKGQRTEDLSILASRRHFSTGSMHLRNRSMLSSSKRARVMEE